MVTLICYKFVLLVLLQSFFMGKLIFFLLDRIKNITRKTWQTLKNASPDYIFHSISFLQGCPLFNCSLSLVSKKKWDKNSPERPLFHNYCLIFGFYVEGRTRSYSEIGTLPVKVVIVCDITQSNCLIFLSFPNCVRLLLILLSFSYL